ncbi:MAG: GNAT family N-acetyltransferase [Acidimicrobiia bacterium]|nr:MAG: GNAT family N-acetyltransferase [Acidimicrobiia bacterium]
MNAKVITDPDEFLVTTTDLFSNEARNNLVLGIAGVMKADPDAYPECNMLIVEHDGVPVAGALVTPPRALILGDADTEEAVTKLVRLAKGLLPRIPGVVGNRPTVHTFASDWAAVTGDDVSVVMNQGVFALEAVVRQPRPEGESRAASAADSDLLVAWLEEFGREAMPHEEHDHEGLVQTVSARVSADSPSGFWFWCVGGSPVSVSGHGGPTRTGIRIGPVYTPPEFRGKGYATALVADQSSALLASGYRFCFLYTDLANETSNDIYKRIGYAQVAESTVYAFTSR